MAMTAAFTPPADEPLTSKEGWSRWVQHDPRPPELHLDWPHLSPVEQAAYDDLFAAGRRQSDRRHPLSLPQTGSPSSSAADRGLRSDWNVNGPTVQSSSMYPVVGSTMFRKPRMCSVCSASDRFGVGLTPNP